MTGAPVAL